MRRIVVLANVKAGLRPARRDEEILRAFHDTGITPDIRFVEGPETVAAATKALSEAPDVIVAAGGDGTVSGVAGVLAGTSVPLGVLPMGTLNHFARDAGIPFELDKAAAIVAAGAVQAVDVAEVNGHVFVNNSSIGIYPRHVRERRRRQREGDAKPLAAIKAAWRVLQSAPAHRVLLSVDGHPVVRTTSFVFIGNNSYETGFGNLGKRKSLSGGHLGVYHVRRPGRTAILALAARALVGRLDGARDFEAQEARRITIASSRTHMRVALDGEVLQLRLPLEYRVRPLDLLFMGPVA